MTNTPPITPPIKGPMFLESEDGESVVREGAT